MPHGNPVDGAQTWGIDGVRSYPRLQRHHIGLFPRLRGANSYLSQEEKIQVLQTAMPATPAMVPNARWRIARQSTSQYTCAGRAPSVIRMAISRRRCWTACEVTA